VSAVVPDGQLLAGLASPAAERGPLALEALSLSKDFRLGSHQVVHAVRDVSFGLYRGAVVSLVGESGSGKSTVAKLLAGQDRPTSGSVRLGGAPVEIASRRAFRGYKSEVQLVFQDPFASLNPIHTVRYHLERPVLLHQHLRTRPEVTRVVRALLEQVRLTPVDDFIAKYPHELSGGQRQRVSFARALAARPSVLLADEPVSMLDVSIRLEMLNLLEQLRRDYQLALLYITHDIASARYFADEILVMYAGKTVERGPAEELTQQPAHPYTQLLVASAPDPDDLGSVLRSAASPTDAAARRVSSVPESGCPFHPRCPYADERCRAEDPPLLQISPRRAAACWNLDVAAPHLAGGHRPAERPEPGTPRSGSDTRGGSGT